MFTDVELACGDRTWKLHSSQLAMASEVFAKMLASDLREGLSKRLEINHCDPITVGWLLEYVYTFELPWTLKSSEVLQVSGAGTDSFDGCYLVDGSSNCRPRFKKKNDRHTVHCDGQHWRMGYDYLPSSQYWNSTILEGPPSEGWSIGLGTLPVPRVTLALNKTRDCCIEDVFRLGELAQYYMMPDLCFDCIEILVQKAQEPHEKLRVLRMFKGLPSGVPEKNDWIKQIFDTLTLADQIAVTEAL